MVLLQLLVRGEVTDFDDMFKNALNARPNVTEWDVSKINFRSDYNGMFHNAWLATPDTRNWDMSKFSPSDNPPPCMFAGAVSVDRDLLHPTMQP